MKSIASLLKIEFIKTYHYKSFRVLGLVYIVTLLLVFVGIQGFLSNLTVNVNNQSPASAEWFPVYSFPGVWQNFTYIAGYLKIFPAFIIIFLITNEFTYQTLRQQLITGLSRIDYLKGKIMLIAIFSVAIALIIAIAGLVAGVLQPSPNYGAILNRGLWFIPIHAFELFTYLTFAALMAILLKRAGIAVIIFILYVWIIERIIGLILPGSLDRFLPMKAVGNLIPVPNSPIMKLFGMQFSEQTAATDLLTSLVYIIVFITSMFLLLRNRDV